MLVEALFMQTYHTNYRDIALMEASLAEGVIDSILTGGANSNDTNKSSGPPLDVTVSSMGCAVSLYRLASVLAKKVMLSIRRVGYLIHLT